MCECSCGDSSQDVRGGETQSLHSVGLQTCSLHCTPLPLLVSQLYCNTLAVICTLSLVYRTAGYIGGNDIWRIARKRKKIAIGGYKFGGYGTIATPSLGVGATLTDLILAV